MAACLSLSQRRNKEKASATVDDILIAVDDPFFVAFRQCPVGRACIVQPTISDL